MPDIMTGYYELGSNAFYIDNQNRTNTAGEKAKALLYVTFDADPANQTLTINATATINDTLKIAPQATPPVTCNAGNAGVIYIDSSGSNELCLCDGSAWQGVSTQTDSNCT
mgnify:CR=1 FL=1